jgi:hypothetical protein
MKVCYGECEFCRNSGNCANETGNKDLPEHGDEIEEDD